MTLRASGKQIRQKGRRHLPCAMKTGEDNDTSVQSQPCRDAGSRNEGGSVRPAEGLDSHEED